MTRSEIHFGKIPKEHWGYPDWVDQEKAKKERQRMQDDRVIYGGSESYRCVKMATWSLRSNSFYVTQAYVPFQLWVSLCHNANVCCSRFRVASSIGTS